MATRKRTERKERREIPEPRLTVRYYATPTAGAEVAFPSWAMWRYWTSTPEEAGLADRELRVHKEALS
jgi:hypothetical protein